MDYLSVCMSSPGVEVRAQGWGQGPNHCAPTLPLKCLCGAASACTCCSAHQATGLPAQLAKGRGQVARQRAGLSLAVAVLPQATLRAVWPVPGTG